MTPQVHCPDNSQYFVSRDVNKRLWRIWMGKETRVLTACHWVLLCTERATERSLSNSRVLSFLLSIWISLFLSRSLSLLLSPSPARQCGSLSISFFYLSFSFSLARSLSFPPVNSLILSRHPPTPPSLSPLPRDCDRPQRSE